MALVLLLYLHEEEDTPAEDMEVAIRAGMEVVTQVVTEDILGVKPAASMDGLQAAQRQGAIS